MAQALTMREIAALAHVQRPVVTMWRRRSKGTAHPFPEPVAHRDGRDLFRREDVVEWLEATGRSLGQRSNPVEALAGDQEAIAAISGLLTVRHLSGSPLLVEESDTHHLLDLAESHDSDDAFLFSELSAVRGLASLARQVEALVAESWDEQDAHRHLMDVSGLGFVPPRLSDAARGLLVLVAASLGRQLGSPVVFDRTGCEGDLLADVAGVLDAPAWLTRGTSPAHRAAVRRLLLADVVPRTFAPEGHRPGDAAIVHLLVLPSPEHLDVSPEEALRVIDEISLELDDRQVALCVAPASILCEPLAGDALATRDQLLRGGTLRAVVQLPAGTRDGRQEKTGLWLLGSPDRTPAADRRTMVADLSDRPIDSLHGLVDDLLAAWQGREGARRRAWAHLYPVPTHQLLAASSTLVPPRPERRPASPRGADLAVRIRSADTGNLLGGFELHPADGTPGVASVEQAISRGWLRVVSGRRLDIAELQEGNVPVVAEIQAGWGSIRPRRSVDRLALAHLAASDLTEPGDVIFTARPRPAAVVDPAGGTLVLMPARILRIKPGAPLLPELVAARINAATTAAWHTWTLAVLDEPDRTRLGEALAVLAAERARLETELAAVDALTTDLTNAVEHRHLTVTKENHG